MRGTWRWLAIGALVLVLAVSFVVVRFLTAAGEFTTFNREIPAACQTLAAVPGPEDIVVDVERGLAFVSATDRRAIAMGGAAADAIRGGIYVVDLNEPVEDWALRPVTDNSPQDFRPHGIGLYIGADGARALFVVNHPAGGPDTVEIFYIAPDGRLAHRRTVTDPAFVALNDVQPVGPDSFYATNDHGSDGRLASMVEDLLMLDRANLVYFDGETAHVVVDGLTYANGVNVSPDGQTVYVTETGDMVLRAYARDAATGALTLADYVALGTGLDNIDVQPDGTLLIAAHPNLVDFVRHAGDPKAPSPSQVVLIEPAADGGGTARTLYLDFGEEMSGASVAAGYGEVMLIGTVFEPKILVCQRDPEINAP